MGDKKIGEHTQYVSLQKRRHARTTLLVLLILSQHHYSES